MEVLVIAAGVFVGKLASDIALGLWVTWRGNAARRKELAKLENFKVQLEKKMTEMQNRKLEKSAVKGGDEPAP